MNDRLRDPGNKPVRIPEDWGKHGEREVRLGRDSFLQGMVGPAHDGQSSSAARVVARTIRDFGASPTFRSRFLTDLEQSIDGSALETLSKLLTFSRRVVLNGVPQQVMFECVAPICAEILDHHLTALEVGNTSPTLSELQISQKAAIVNILAVGGRLEMIDRFLGVYLGEGESGTRLIGETTQSVSDALAARRAKDVLHEGPHTSELGWYAKLTRRYGFPE